MFLVGNQVLVNTRLNPLYEGFFMSTVLEVLLLFFRLKPGATCDPEERGSDGSILPVSYYLSEGKKVAPLQYLAPEPTLAGCRPCNSGSDISLKKVV